jgi:purine nucleosidase
MRTILDTDIGTDVDDCLALAFLLGSPEIELAGITCVYGDVELRARMVGKLLQLAGRGDVPVFLGAREPLLRRRPVYWAGHEGEGLLAPDDDLPPPEREHAVDYLVRTVMAEPGAFHLLAIGPLTNVAMAFQREPRLPTALAGLTIMGGAVRGPGRLDLPYAEHNIACDPEAADIVLASGAPVSLVPLDVTTRVTIDRAALDVLRGAGRPFLSAIADQVARYPYFVEHGATYLHDPLAAALTVRPELAEWHSLHIDVETDGRHAAAMTLARAPAEDAPANSEVALGVDPEAAQRFVLERLLASSSASAV